MMKKLIILFFFSVIMASCYDDYIKDYNYTSVYFPFQANVRTFVVGEGMNIKVGVVLGGVMENLKDRQVDFTLDNSLISSKDVLGAMNNGLPYVRDGVAGLTALDPLPSSYYTISDPSKMIVKAGMHTGTVTIKADSAAFLADPNTLKAQYVLPFLITGTSNIDSITTSKNYAVVGLRYENMLFGNWYHGGVTAVKDAAGNVVSTTNYFTAIPQADNLVWKLKTVAPNALETNGISNKPGSFRITLDGNNIIVSQATGSAVVVQPDGASTFNRSKLLQDRKIVLSYKYANADGTTSYAQDTLTFRNRIRDGVNEWQDENPGNYSK
jgi:hypothetical protein